MLEEERRRYIRLCSATKKKTNRISDVKAITVNSSSYHSSSRYPGQIWCQRTVREFDQRNILRGRTDQYGNVLGEDEDFRIIYEKDKVVLDTETGIGISVKNVKINNYYDEVLTGLDFRQWQL